MDFPSKNPLESCPPFRRRNC